MKYIDQSQIEIEQKCSSILFNKHKQYGTTVKLQISAIVKRKKERIIRIISTNNIGFGHPGTIQYLMGEKTESVHSLMEIVR